MSITNPNACFDLYKSGKKLSFKQACLAKCADCTNSFSDGREDCQIPTCPIYPFMPYRDSKNNESQSNRPKRVLTDVQKAAMAKGRKNKASGRLAETA
jgi:hypothetical protein